MARTILFIHGTGVRTPAFVVTMKVLQRKVAEHLPGWRLEGCSWGDAFGARLNLRGVSVPGYGASGEAAPALEAAAQARWVLLASDPLIELRVAPESEVIGPAPGPQLWKGLGALSLRTAQAVLQEHDLADEWPRFHAELVKDKAWAGTISALTLKGPAVNDKIARALVAEFQRHLRENSLPSLTREGREALVAAVLSDLGGAGLGLTDWFLKCVTNFMQPRRGKITDATGPVVGDILRYQARGETLRKFIGEEVQRTGAEVLLGHSLGGIAAVDFLAEQQRDVKALITAGSQAAYFYEIDALKSRVFGQGLPSYFPKRWLNAYDERDFLSYRGSEVFPGQVEDAQVASGQPFPDSHGAYWHNDKEFWKPVANFLR